MHEMQDSIDCSDVEPTTSSSVNVSTNDSPNISTNATRIPSDFKHKDFELTNSAQRFLSQCHHFDIRSYAPFVITKQMVFDALVDSSESLVVCQHPDEKEFRLIHVFMKAIKDQKNRTITWMLYQNCCKDFKIYYNHCKKPEAAIKEVSQLDPYPLCKGVKTSCLSTVAKTYAKAQQSNVIDPSDPELIADPVLYKALRNSHKAIREKLSPMSHLLPIIYKGQKFGDALDLVIGWLNGYITKGWEFKSPQLYVHGPSGVGKTTMIEMVLKPYTKHRFSPMRGKDNRFTWSAFDPQQHNHVFIDEFKREQFNDTDLNLLLSGECLVTDKKFKNQQDVYMKVPIIICSNYPPEDTMPGFLERLYVVKVEKQGRYINNISKWIDYDDEVMSLPLLYTKHKPKHGQLKLKTPKFMAEILADVKRHDEEVENGSESDDNDEDDGVLVNEEHELLTPTTDTNFFNSTQNSIGNVEENSLEKVKRSLSTVMEEYRKKPRQEVFEQIKDIDRMLKDFMSKYTRTDTSVNEETSPSSEFSTPEVSNVEIPDTDLIQDQTQQEYTPVSSTQMVEVLNEQNTNKKQKKNNTIQIPKRSSPRLTVKNKSF